MNMAVDLPEQIEIEPLPLPSIKRKNGWVGVSRLGGIGDNLICASPLKLLREKFGRLEMITQEPQGVVYENNPHIDKLSLFDPKSAPNDTGGNYQQYWRGRANEYDAFYHFNHSCETIRALFPGQTQFNWPASMRRKFCGQNYLETVHDISEVGYEFGPLFFPTEQEHDQAERTKKKVSRDRPVIVWIISGTRLDKLHPQSSEIVAQLIREVGPVIALGGPGKDYELARTLQQDIVRYNGNDRGFHLGLSPDPKNETWPIRRVLSQAIHADCIVGPDTGPSWAVAFERTPQIMLLSHASAENITKHWRNCITLHADYRRVPCGPCHQLHDTIATCTPNRDGNGAACISDIGVQCVVTAVKAQLGCQTSLERLRKNWTSNVII
jgi:ADP-heptose:LPS heptosyltransferase